MSDAHPHYRALLQQLHTLDDLHKAAAVLYWDRETCMPVQGNAGRTQQLTTLNQLVHEMATSTRMADLLAAAELEQASAVPDSDVPACCAACVGSSMRSAAFLPSSCAGAVR